MNETKFYPNEIWFDIETLITEANPNSVALLGQFPDDFLVNYSFQRELLHRPITLAKVKGAQALEFNTQVDVAVVCGLLENCERLAATHFISRLRDIHCPQFCLTLPIHSGDETSWTLSELFALGLKIVSRYKLDQSELALLSFNLNAYKSTPDWLNADNWANPKMWDKYRW